MRFFKGKENTLSLVGKNEVKEINGESDAVSKENDKDESEIAVENNSQSESEIAIEDDKEQDELEKDNKIN